MNVPNLASRPFLNTRPVWLVTVVAVAITLVLLVVNIELYRASNRSLAEQLEHQRSLRSEYTALQTEVRSHVVALDRVPWRTLRRQVDGLNVILLEHGFSWLTLLDDVERVMPYDVRLTRITPAIETDGVGLTLEGVARTRDAMLQFFENLIADQRFHEPIPQWETHPEESGAVGYVFTLKVSYEPIVEEPDPVIGEVQAEPIEDQAELEEVPGEAGEVGP